MEDTKRRSHVLPQALPSGAKTPASSPGEPLPDNITILAIPHFTLELMQIFRGSSQQTKPMWKGFAGLKTVDEWQPTYR